MHEETAQKHESAKDETPFLLSDEAIREIITAVKAQDADTVHLLLQDLSAADIAELIAKIDEDERRELLSMYGEHFDPVAFAEMNPDILRTAFQHMNPSQVASIISAQETDDALEMIEPLNEELQKEVLRKLSVKMRTAVKEGLNFPEDSAGRLMQREFVAVPQFWDVKKTIDYLRSAADDLPEDFFDIFIINPAYHVVGHIPLNKLIRAPREEKIENLSLAELHLIPATMDQEEVAHIFRRDDVASAPVIDENGRLIGVITIDDVIDVIDEEAEEDILKLAGVEQDDLYRAVIFTSGARSRWLVVNLISALIASVVISMFGATIEQVVALAALMPVVASLGGNAGMQALAVTVRALATREISETNTWRVIWKELLVGSLNGVAFAAIVGIVTMLWFNNPILGAIIAAAIIINLVVAGLCGAGIPIIVSRLGGDPAVSSSIFLTAMTDIVGFLAFLGLATVLLL